MLRITDLESYPELFNAVKETDTITCLEFEVHEADEVQMSLLKAMLILNPANRIRSKSLTSHLFFHDGQVDPHDDSDDAKRDGRDADE
jgi:serine/threonine protein kinase